MSSRVHLEVPTVEGYQHEDSYSLLGEHYVSYRGVGGLELVLSAAGVQALDKVTGFPDQIADVSQAIMARSSGHDERRKLSLEGEEVWYRESRSLDLGKPPAQRSSLYVTKTAPTIVVKSFDHNPSVANLQFHAMTTLGNRLDRNGAPNIQAPAQFAFFADPQTGHKAIVMEYAKSTEPLEDKVETMEDEAGGVYPEITMMRSALNHLIARNLERAVPSHTLRKLLINDAWRRDYYLLYAHDLLVAQQPPLNLGNVKKHTYTLLDQPHGHITGHTTEDKIINHMIALGKRI